MSETEARDRQSPPAAELRRKAEDRLCAREASSAKAVSEADARALLHELQVHQIELEMQNEELHRAEAAAKEAAEKYRDLFDFAPIGYFLWDHEGRILEVNLTGAALLGLDRSTVVQQRFGQFVAVEDRARFADFCHRVLQADAKETCEVKILKQGQVVDVLVEGIAAQEHQGQGKLCRAAVIDITHQKLADELAAANRSLQSEIAARKQSEEALRESEAKHRALFEQAADAIVVLDPKTLSIVDFNDEACRRLGYTREEFAKLKIPDLDVSESVEDVNRHVQEIIAKGSEIFKTKQRAKSGAVLDIEIRAKTVRLDRGVIVQGIWRDITAQKHAEEALRNAAQQWQVTFDAVGDSVFLLDAEQRIRRANKAAETLFGKSAAEMEGHHCCEIVHGGTTPIPKCPVPRLHDSLHREVVELAIGDRCFTVTVDPVLNANGGLAGIVHIFRDTTKRKRVEKHLAATKNYLAAELDAMTRLHTINTHLLRQSNLHGVFDEIVETAIAVTHADMGDIRLFDTQSGTLKIMAHKGFKQPFLDFFGSVQEGHAACGTVLRQGRRVIVENVAESPIFAGTPELQAMLAAGARAVQSTPLLSHAGRLLGVLSTHYRTPRRLDEGDLRHLDLLARLTADTIEQSEADAALRKSEERFRKVSENAPFGIGIDDSHGRVLFVNAEFERMFGYSLHDMPMQAEWFVLAYPDERYRGQVFATWSEDLRRMRCGEIKRSPVREYSVTCRDGAVKNVEITFAVVGDFTYVVFNDITDRKRAEEEIQSLNATLERRVSERTEVIQLLYDVAVLVNQAQNAGQAMEYCLQRVAAYNGWSFGHVLLPSADKPDELVAAYAYYPEDSERFRRFREATLGMRTPRGQDICGRVFASGQPEWTTDVRRDLVKCRAVLAEELGIGTAMALPVLVGRKVAAVLEFFSERAIHPDQRITDAMAGIGMELGRVVERADFEEHLMAIAEKTQQGIAQDLHDDVGQELTGLGLKAETLVEMLASSKSRAGKLAADVAAAVDRTRGKVRKLSRGLLPVALEEGDLVGAIGQLAAAATTGSHIACAFHCSHPDLVGDSRVAMHVYRIAQEAVSNAVRHSGARNIRITLLQEHGETVLSVADDGAGLPGDAPPPGGMGLRTMRYRAGLIGGALEVGPGPNGGTLVVCRLPLRKCELDT